MWYDIENKDNLYTESLLMTTIKQDSQKHIFILDAPSGAGKSYFLDHFAGGKCLRVPSNLIREILYYTNDIRTNMEILIYFLSQIHLDFIYIEDIDYSFGNYQATQEVLANIVLWVSKSYKIILTGTNIDRACNNFLECLPDQYRYFKFSKQ